MFAVFAMIFAVFAVSAMSAVFRQSSANGDGDGENDRKEGFHGTKVFRCCPLACVYPMVVAIARCESPIQVPQKPSAFHPHAQRNAFRRRDARLQSRTFARKHDSAS